MKKIMIIAPPILPIPAVGGGAIETLITHLLEVNESEQKVRFVVVSKYDSEAEKRKYRFSDIYYFENNVQKKNKLPFLNVRFKFLIAFKTIAKKVLNNRYTIKIFKHRVYIPNLFIYQCYKIAKKEKIDALVSEGWSIGDMPPFVRLLGIGNVYFHLHCETAESIEDRRIVPNSISISRFVRDAWVKDLSIAGKNEVVYNGIDLNRFTAPLHDSRRSELRAALNVNPDDVLVIFCGRLIPVKGVEQLLDAFDLIQNDKIKLLLIGSVCFSVDVTDDYSERMVKRAQESRAVRYLGYISNECLAEYYHCSDIQVIPSIWQEGAGLVAVEGMASGLPIVATRSGGMTEYLSEDCSFQLPIDDDLAKNIAEKIEILAADKELRKTMGEAGKIQAKNFSKENYYRNYIKIFE